jgi:hypothetical protein
LNSKGKQHSNYLWSWDSESPSGRNNVCVPTLSRIHCNLNQFSSQSCPTNASMPWQGFSQEEKPTLT